MKFPILTILFVGPIFVMTVISVINEKVAPAGVQSVTNMPTASYEVVSETEAESIVRQLPEVKAFLAIPYKDNSKPFIEVQDNDPSAWTVWVAEAVRDNEMVGHSATFNWYAVEKRSGKILCSMFLFDEVGTFLRSSESNEYPCT